MKFDILCPFIVYSVIKRPPICKPKRKIGFLKTHKCASSSIQNVLMRFVIKNKLNVVLPGKTNLNFFGHDPKYERGENNTKSVKFNRKMLENTKWEQAHLPYDVFLCHTQWDHDEISHVLNDNGDAFYFSLLREPVAMFRSFWDFYKLHDDYKMSLEEYATKYIAKEIKYKNKTRRSRGYNQMLTDFGMDFEQIHPNPLLGVKDKDGVKNVLNYIKQIDRNFDLIILTGKAYYEDSIILLKHALCWNYEDIIGVKQNVMKKSKKSSMSNRAKTNIKGTFIFFIQKYFDTNLILIKIIDNF